MNRQNLPKDEESISEKTTVAFSYAALFLPYALPYMAYVAIAGLLDTLDPGINYVIRIITVSTILAWAFRLYVPFRGPGRWYFSVIVGITFGLIGTFLWIVLLSPFVQSGKLAWDNFDFCMRLIAASLLVPIFEELFMRVYVFRLAHHWYIQYKISKKIEFDNVFNKKSLNEFQPGEWSIFAVVFSTIIFALGHQSIEWPAAVIYGFLMSFLWIIRKDILTCIVAHAATNFFLGIYVFVSGSWEYW